LHSSPNSKSPLFPYTTLFRSSTSLPPTARSDPPSAMRALEQPLVVSRVRLFDGTPVPALLILAVAWLVAVAALPVAAARIAGLRSEEHTSELQSLRQTVCRLL